MPPSTREISTPRSRSCTRTSTAERLAGGRNCRRGCPRAGAQFETIDPRSERFAEEDGRIAVDVHQVVRSRDGELLADQRVRHVYTVRDGLIERMEIEG